MSVSEKRGVARSGLSGGGSINWKARDGRLHQMTALSVVPPRAEQIATAADQLEI